MTDNNTIIQLARDMVNSMERLSVEWQNDPDAFDALLGQTDDRDFIFDESLDEMVCRGWAWVDKAIEAAKQDHLKVVELSQVFFIKLKEEVGADAIEQIRITNTQGMLHGLTSCASHDHTDSNMTMYDAFCQVFDRAPDINDGGDTAIWNEAWNIAKTEHLTNCTCNSGRCIKHG